MSFQYFQRYGDEGTTGRFNAPTLRGNYNNQLYVHTAKNETRNWITPTPTPTISVTPSITPTISITPSITTTISITPSITVTPTISVTPSITPSAIPVDLSSFSIRNSSSLATLVVTGVRYYTNPASAINKGTQFETHPFDITGNWTRVSYVSNGKQLWVKDDDVATFNSNQHVTGIYSMEVIDVSGQSLLITRGSGKGETISHGSLTDPNEPAWGYTDPTLFGTTSAHFLPGTSRRTPWFGINGFGTDNFNLAQPSYNENTPLGFRTGHILFLTDDGGGGESEGQRMINFEACYDDFSSSTCDSYITRRV